MVNRIKEKRKFSFEKKRVSHEIILRMARVIDDAYNDAIAAKEENLNIVYSIDCAEDSSFESQSIIIFDEIEILGQRKAEKINMKFNTINNSKNIEVQIVDSVKNDNNNYIIVSGDDSIWTKGIFMRLQEIINSSEPQFKRGRIAWVIFLGWILMEVYTTKILFPLSDNIIPALILIFLWFALVFGAFYLYSHIQHTYPNVEIQTGQEHLQTANNRRKVNSLIIFTIIIPVVLAIIYDIIKNYI